MIRSLGRIIRQKRRRCPRPPAAGNERGPGSLTEAEKKFPAANAGGSNFLRAPAQSLVPRRISCGNVPAILAPQDGTAKSNAQLVARLWNAKTSTRLTNDACYHSSKAYALRYSGSATHTFSLAIHCPSLPGGLHCTDRLLPATPARAPRAVASARRTFPDHRISRLRARMVADHRHSGCRSLRRISFLSAMSRRTCFHPTDHPYGERLLSLGRRTLGRKAHCRHSAPWDLSLSCRPAGQ